MRTMKELSGDAGQPQGSERNLQTLLDSSASLIDSTLYGRVALPLSPPVPLMLTDKVCDITAYRLFLRRPSMPEAVKQLYADAQKWLEDFRMSLVSLPGVGAAVVPELQDSNYPTGGSQFSNVMGDLDSPTGPINPGGNIANA